MEKSKLIAVAALNALGVLVYVFLVSLVISNASQIFGVTNKTLIGPMIFLLLFVFSALVTGGLVLGRPIMLYLDGAKKDGVKLFIYTGVMLLVLLILSFLKLWLFR